MKGIQNYLLLFADLVGSTDVAVEMSPAPYAGTYIASFHWAVRKAMEFVKSEEAFKSEHFSRVINGISVAGEEALSFTPLDGTGGVKWQKPCFDLVASGVAFAYVTKLYWLASPYNLQRMIGSHFPRDVAIGIHIGPAVRVPNLGQQEQTIASLHINITKRIEGQARNGEESRIFASFEVHKGFTAWLEDVHREAGTAKRSPLSFTNFHFRGNPRKVQGVPKKLQMMELEWPIDGKDFKDLTDLLTRLRDFPEVSDIESEGAARILAKIFLPFNDNPFFYGDTAPEQLAIEAWGMPYMGTAAAYIKSWFGAVENLNRLFFDECWLVLNCYLVSCSFLRHEAVGEQEQDWYQNVTETVWKRLKELIERKKEEAEQQGQVAR